MSGRHWTREELKAAGVLREHVQLYLNEGEENLIRRIRMADYKGAGWQFEKLKAERMAEDAVIAKANGAGTV